MIPPLRMGGSADSALVNHSWVLAHAALNNMVTVAARPPCPALDAGIPRAQEPSSHAVLAEVMKDGWG